MDKQDFLAAGYREYEVGILENDWAESFLQKEMRVVGDVVYFINVFVPRPLELFSSPIVCRMQLDIAEGTLNLELFHFKSIESMEAFCENVFTRFRNLGKED